MAAKPLMFKMVSPVTVVSSIQGGVRNRTPVETGACLYLQKHLCINYLGLLELALQLCMPLYGGMKAGLLSCAAREAGRGMCFEDIQRQIRGRPEGWKQARLGGSWQQGCIPNPIPHLSAHSPPLASETSARRRYEVAPRPSGSRSR